MIIPFNKPYTTGNELEYIQRSIENGHLSGNGDFTKKCQIFFENSFGFIKTLLTTSCTDALEMCAMLLDIKPGDEIILPSYTFVSTALAFTRQGAILKFVDSRPDRPGIDEEKIEELITKKTKAIVVVHYAGVACNMKKIKELSDKYNIFIVEDAAQAITSTFNNLYLGGIGHLATFSFHETKNIQCGEGGLLVINDERFIRRAEIIWEKGTNRSEFFQGIVNKYGWVDTGSSFLPSEITAAFLFAQLEQIEEIQKKRKEIWNKYFNSLQRFERSGLIKLPVIPNYSSNNAHMFYILFNDMQKRTFFIDKMKELNISTVFHYLSLHKSDYYKNKHDGRKLQNADRYSDTLVRLPLYYDLYHNDLDKVILQIMNVLDQISYAID